MTLGFLRFVKEKRAARCRKANRIDYYESDEALELIRGRVGKWRPANNQSGTLNAIVLEWAELTGAEKRPETRPMSSPRSPEFSDANARE